LNLFTWRVGAAATARPGRGPRFRERLERVPLLAVAQRERKCPFIPFAREKREAVIEKDERMKVTVF